MNYSINKMEEIKEVQCKAEDAPIPVYDIFYIPIMKYHDNEWSVQYTPNIKDRQEAVDAIKQYGEGMDCRILRIEMPIHTK